MPNENEDTRYFKYLFYLILSTTIFRLIYINIPNLAPQEAYYWNYSRHLSLSYFDHPPILAWSIYLFTHIGTQSAFFVRIGCVLISAGITYLTYIIGKSLFDAKIGFYSALLLNCILIFSLGAIIATPDTPMIFFWVLSFYFFTQLVLTQKSRWWYFLGISTGLALLSKYTAVFIVISVFCYLVLSKRNRRWLFTKEPYFALLLAFLVFLPVIIWNAQNHWVSFLFQSSRRAGELGSLSPRHFFGYFGAQIGVISPFIYFSLIYAMIRSGIIGLGRRYAFKSPPLPNPLPQGERGLLNGREKFLLCFCWSFPIIFLFTLVATIYWVKMNWVSAGYFSASITSVALFFNFQEKGRKWVKAWSKIALIVSLIFVILAHILPLAKFIPVSSSVDTISGWRELAQKVEEERSKMREGTIVVGYGYKVPSEIAFYTSLETYSNNMVGENGLQFDFWSKPNEFLGKDAILVYDQRERYKDPERLKNFFASVEELEPLKVYRGGRVLTIFHIFRCLNYQGTGK